jgi:hypothetical protein
VPTLSQITINTCRNTKGTFTALDVEAVYLSQEASEASVSALSKPRGQNWKEERMFRSRKRRANAQVVESGGRIVGGENDILLSSVRTQRANAAQTLLHGSITVTLVFNMKEGTGDMRSDDDQLNLVTIGSALDASIAQGTVPPLYADVSIFDCRRHDEGRNGFIA